MKSDSELMNELAHRTNYLRPITEEESQAMKRALTAMYLDLQKLCDTHNLRLMLGGGSCLGAIRHHGFIPWDDDLDVMIPRHDYEVLIRLIQEGALGSQYTYSTPNRKTESAYCFLKIYLKDSINKDIFTGTSPFPQGLYIDVFAIDAVPNNRFIRLCKGFIANMLQFCSILTLYAKYPNPRLREYMSLDPQLFRRYKIKCIIGKIVNIIPRRKWQWWFDQWVADDRESGLWTVPTGRRYYEGEVIPRDVFVPIKNGIFEGEVGHIPNDYNAYLTNLYGDYMQLPPEDKRERHFICQLNIPENI